MRSKIFIGLLAVAQYLVSCSSCVKQQDGEAVVDTLSVAVDTPKVVVETFSESTPLR